jgi:hypothetical protein
VGGVIPADEEQALLDGKLNCMLIGLHGTGKSATVRSLADRYGLKVAIYNAATMDPHTELIGVPMPRMIHVYDGATGKTEAREVLRMIRPQMIDDCHVVFIDELNRAPVETQNACMEMCNERTINGEPLPNLLMVFSAINPPDEDYNVGLIDKAMIDRWDTFYDIKPSIRTDVLEHVDGLPAPVAKALKTWYDEANHARRETYISPRRVAKFGKVFMACQKRSFLQAAVPPGTVCDIGKLHSMLMEAVGKGKGASADDKKLAETTEDPKASRPAVKAKKGKAPKAPGAGFSVSDVQAAHAKHLPSALAVAALAESHFTHLLTHISSWPQSSRYRFRRDLQATVTAAGPSHSSDFYHLARIVNSYTPSKDRIVLP